MIWERQFATKKLEPTEKKLKARLEKALEMCENDHIEEFEDENGTKLIILDDRPPSCVKPLLCKFLVVTTNSFVCARRSRSQEKREYTEK